MGRGMTIAVLTASVVGSVAGGLAALHAPWGSSTTRATPAAPTAAQLEPAAAGSSAVAAPAPVKPTSPPQAPHADVAAQMKPLLAQFAGWARDHAGAPCPEPSAFAVALDPWGHPIALTCTDQPADQRVGAISAGPDGIAGNDDDVASWNLGHEVTDLVRGPRWKAAPPTTQAPPARHPKEATATPGHLPAVPTTRPAAPTAHPAAPTKPSAAPLDAGTDDIPARR